ncbi:MAG: hypothetical protein GC157_01850 [Frankiales bacterium]|nr:hypothetical protein [Frankiales bacterium]
MSDAPHPRTAALVSRVRAAEGPDGRLALPEVTEWDIFPFEGDLRVKRLEDPVLPEPPRTGEGGRPCGACEHGIERAVWADDRWLLVPLEPTPVPTVLLEPRAHLDSVDLDEAMAADLGVLTLHLERVLLGLGGFARVHVMKIGDGGAHLHVWFMARPEGLLQLRGSSLTDWSDALPPMPAEEWTALAAQIARDLAAVRGGEVLTPAGGPAGG